MQPSDADNQSRVTSSRRHKMRAAVTITVVGGSLVVNGQPAGAATLTVTNTNPNGAGSLSQAIDDAAPGDTIDFQAGLTGTITLDGPNHKIDSDLTIVGPGRSAITLTNNAGGVLYVYKEADLTVSGLTIANVSGATAPAAITVNDGGDLVVTDVSISTIAEQAIFVSHNTGEASDSVTLTDVDVTDAGTGGTGDDGIYINEAATVSFDDVTVSGSGVGTNGDGIDIEDVLDLSISNTVVTESAARGMEAYPIDGPASVTDSRFENNGDTGLYLDAEVDDVIVVSRVVANGNGDNGIDLYSGNFTLTDVTADNNDFNGVEGHDIYDLVTMTNVTTTGNGESGIYLFDIGAATLTNITTVGNDSLGIELYGTAGDITLTNIVASGNIDGGMYVDDTDGKVTLDGFTDTATVGGTTTVGNGDGSTEAWSVYVTDAGDDVTVDDATITGEFWIDTVSGNVSVTNVTVDRNAVLDAEYPQFYVQAVTGDVTIDSVSVSDSNEEGMWLKDVAGTTTVDNSTISGSGFAALYAADLVGGLTITNSTIGENDVSTAAVVEVVNADVTIAHATVSGNSSTGPAVINLDGTSNLVLDHAIVAGNDGDVSHAGGASVAGSFSLLATGSGLAGTNIETADPLLGALADNGGPTRTMLPAAMSPAVEAGNPAFAAPPAFDQRGQARVVGPVIDIGAVELLGDAITPLAPARFLDTRATGETIDNQFEKGGKLAAGEEITVQIAGRGDVPANAVGVVMNVTAVAGEAVGFVTVHPCVSPRPLASSINYTPGVNLGNELVSGLDASGQVCLYSKEAAHLTIDVVGYVVANSPLRNVTPARLLDTREIGETIDGISEGAGRPGAGSSTTVKVAGRGGVPADARTVIVNVTAVRSTQRGFVTVTPCADPIPTASSLNYVAATNRANELVAELNSNGELCLFTSSDAHLLVDVVGYIGSPSSFTSVAPSRLLDSRPTGTTIDAQDQAVGKRQAGTSYTLDVEGRVGVPASATAVVVNVTAVAPEGRGYVTVHPCLSTLPLASSLNFVEGVNGPNEIVATLSADGKICLFNSTTTHLVVDIVGFLE